jgi:hypothetical protein
MMQHATRNDSQLGCAGAGAGSLVARRSSSSVVRRPLVRWVLSTPPGHPTAHGWAVRPCRASDTSLAPLHSPCARPAFGWGSKRAPPAPRSALRASSRGVPPGAPNTLPVLSAIHPRGSCLSFRALWLHKTRPIGTRCLQLHAGPSSKLLLAPRPVLCFMFYCGFAVFEQSAALPLLAAASR